MKKVLRTLLLSAAALGTALVAAPRLKAESWVGFGFHARPPLRFYRPHAYSAPFPARYPFYAPRYRHFYAPPFRVISGIRFYNYCPGPGYVYVDDGWVLPPYAGAVWVPGYTNRFGVFIVGHWR